MNRFTTMLTISALAIGATAAYASPADGVLQVTVHYADVDLTRTEGAAILYRRLTNAADTVCAPLDTQYLRDRYKACRQHAISEAVAKVGRPALTAYYEAVTKRHSGAWDIARR